jgi:ribosomal protein L37AE/L43A
VSEHSLRGTGLGSSSYESDRGVQLVARRDESYHCTNGHTVIITFAAGAAAPAVWECPHCGSEALREGGQAPVRAAARPARTHWDMLLERRSIHELHLLLEERLALLRGGSSDRRSA